MRIQGKHKKYELKADENQFIMYEIQIAGKDAKEPGSERLTNPRYYPKASMLFAAMLDIELRDDVNDWQMVEDLVSSFAGTIASIENQLTSKLQN